LLVNITPFHRDAMRTPILQSTQISSKDKLYMSQLFDIIDFHRDQHIKNSIDKIINDDIVNLTPENIKILASY